MREVRIFETKSGSYKLGRVLRGESGEIASVEFVPRDLLTPDEIESAICDAIEDVLSELDLEGITVTVAEQE